MKENSLIKVGASVLGLTLASATLFASTAEAADTVKLSSSTNIFMSADAAASDTNAVARYSAGDYYIYRTLGDFVNITRHPGVPGGWLRANKLSDTGSEATILSTSTSSSATSLRFGEDRVKLSSSVSIHMNAFDALSGTNSRGTFAAGEYYIFREFNGAVNISTRQGIPGGWVVLNEGQTTSSTTTTTSKDDTSLSTGSRYTLDQRVSGFSNASDAKNGTNPVSTMGAGTYYIYRTYSNGMINISTSKTAPGAWINPDHTSVLEVKSTEVKEVTSSPATSSLGYNIVSSARQYLGSRYVYGSSNPNVGFDCSGFVAYVYGQYGIYLPHSSRSQATRGTYVAKSDLQAGDLVFFGSSINNIWHVGIYDGNGNIVHAESENTGVVVTPLSQGYYTRNYVTARRVLN